MTSSRRRKAHILAVLFDGRRRELDVLREWDSMAPVGREFGSPDFEQLMEADRRAGVGVFDPALKEVFRSVERVSKDADL